MPSRPTQVAIFPDPQQTYVPESNRKSLGQQQELLEVDLIEIVKKKMGIGGASEVIDSVATYAGLAFAYHDRTGGVRLHGKDYDLRYVRSVILTAGPFVARVGHFDDNGLDIRDEYKSEGSDNVWSLRLLVPAQE